MRPNVTLIKRVYPRVCGGSFPLCTWGISLRGLSPRVRGKHTLGLIAAAAAGSIPACAGEAGWQVDGHYSYEVYPRVCGGSLSSDSM